MGKSTNVFQKDFFKIIFGLGWAGLVRPSEQWSSSPLFKQNNGGVGDDEGEEVDLAALAVLVAHGGVVVVAAGGFRRWFFFFLCFCLASSFCLCCFSISSYVSAGGGEGLRDIRHGYWQKAIVKSILRLTIKRFLLLLLYWRPFN